MSSRKIERGAVVTGCPVRHGADGAWQVTGFAAGREVLRSTDTVQAGLGVETVEKLPPSIRRPVLYRDGEEHREHRRQTARFFTPRRVDEHYRGLMERVADEQLAMLTTQHEADLAKLSFRMAIEVVSAVIGLTDSRPGLDKRLDAFFPEKFGRPGFTSLNGIRWVFKQNVQFLGIYLADVRPAVRRRRRQRQDDLISHLIDEGCRDGEILGECLTFAAAGMVTTREFVNVVAWHLFTDEALRERYTGGDEPDRVALLHELLRLEPVVGNLKRRTTAELTAGDAVIPKDALVDVNVSAANLEEAGDGPGLAFGDGPHRCPGAYVAIQEADIFLSKLFALPDLRMVQPPRVAMKPDISSYELRDFIVSVRPPG
ncbi:cytochrome P450 [Dactylosporangium sp. NPDC049525]|uniref:cytochrome P450 n=1 Tax=Dactylosporangium sp. NPDC049525 TaxID=3154730 RepID=UPI00342257EF